jgi:hypothetical protein
VQPRGSETHGTQNIDALQSRPVKRAEPIGRLRKELP